MRRFGRLVLSLGLAVSCWGVAAAADTETTTFKSAAEREEATIQARVDRVVRLATERLELDASQANRLRPLLTRHYVQLGQVAERQRTLPAETAQLDSREDARDERDQFHAALADVLTADQLAAFKQMQSGTRMRAILAREPE